jgi:hypothetical protein
VTPAAIATEEVVNASIAETEAANASAPVVPVAETTEG